MRDPVQRVVEPFLAEVDARLAGRYSAVLYGSAARGDYVGGRSDINLLLILDDVTPDVLRSLGEPFARWRKSESEPPLLISRAEWSRATDVFPLEITDMRRAYRVLRGGDPIADLVVARADLRHALERELRGKLVRLRQGYAAGAGDTAALGALAIQSVPTVLLLLRSTLVLADRPAPSDPTALVAEAARTIGFAPASLLEVVSHRADREWRWNATAFDGYLAVVEETVRFVDQLQPGEF